jgi:hypothetical protein
MANCNRDQYTGNDITLPGIRKVQIDPVSTPAINNVSVPTASTEVSFALPSGTKRFTIKARQTARLQLSFESGESGTEYLTVHAGCAFSESSLDSSVDYTLYFQSSVAGITVEILSWS